MNWIVYNELAWTDNVLACPESYEEEAMNYAKLIKEVISVPFPTMLHLGCGAGGHDFHFKKHFQVTGVRIKPRHVRLGRKDKFRCDLCNGRYENYSKLAIS